MQSLLVFIPKSAKKKAIAKIHINCKKCILQQQLHIKCQKARALQHSPRGQRPFQHGNSIGTVPGTGYGKTFALQFGTNRCLGVLQKICIINKNAGTCSKCMKKCKKLGYCSPAPPSQGQFHSGFSVVISHCLLYTSPSPRD